MKLPIQYPYGNFKWLTSIPSRFYAIMIAITAPLRALVWVLDGIVAATMVAIIFTVIAWWTHHISDDQVAAVAGELGNRILNILHKAQIF